MVQKLEFSIEVDPNTGKAALKSFESGLDSTAKTAKKTSKEATKGFESLEGSIVAVSAAVTLVGLAFNGLVSAAAAPLNLFKALASVSVDLVETYNTQAEAVLSLGGAMANAGQFTREALQDFEDFASELQNTTNVGDEVILKNQAILGSFVGFGPPLKDATRAALDLAAGFGVDVETAFRKFIKAAKSGSLELAEGVVTTLKATDAEGRLAEAVVEVNKLFQGRAALLAGLGSGPVDALVLAFGDLQEQIGGAIRQSVEFETFIKVAKQLVLDLSSFIADNLEATASALGAAFLAAFNFAKIGVEIAIGAVLRFSDTVISVIQLLEGFQFTLPGGQQIGFLSQLRKDVEGSLALLRDFDTDLLKRRGSQIFEAFGPALEGAKELGVALNDINSTTDLTPENIEKINDAVDATLTGIKGASQAFVDLALASGQGLTGFADASADVQRLQFGMIRSLGPIAEIVEKMNDLADASARVQELQDDPTAGLAKLLELATSEGGPVDLLDKAIADFKKLVLEGRAQREAEGGLTTDLDKGLGTLTNAAQAAGSAASGMAGDLRLLSGASDETKTAIDALNAALGEAGTQDDPFGKFSGSLDDVLPKAEKFKQLAEGLDVALRQGLDLGDIGELRIGADIEKATTQARASFKKFGAGASFEVDNIINLVSQLGPEFQAANPGVASVVSEMEKLSAELKGVKTASDDSLTNLIDSTTLGQLDALARELEEAQGSTESAAAAMRNYSEVTDNLDDRQIDAAVQALNSGAQSADGFTESLRTVIDAANRASRGVKEISDNIQELGGTVEIKVRTDAGGTGSPEQAAAVIETHIDRAADSLNDAGDELEDSAGELGLSADELDNAAGELDSAALAIDRAGSSLQEPASSLDNAAAEMERSAAEHSTAAQELLEAARAFQKGTTGGSGVQSLTVAARDLSGAANSLTRAAQDISNAAERLRPPGQQHGGIAVASQSTVVEVGEAGPELILPLNPRGVSFLSALAARQGGGAGGGGVSITFSGNTIMSSNLDEFADEVERRIALRIADSQEVTL